MEKPSMSKISRPAGVAKVLYAMIDETNALCRENVDKTLKIEALDKAVKKLQTQNIGTTLQTIVDERAVKIPKKAVAKPKKQAKAKTKTKARKEAKK